jgi:hypothetical protein
MHRMMFSIVCRIELWYTKFFQYDQIYEICHVDSVCTNRTNFWIIFLNVLNEMACFMVSTICVNFQVEIRNSTFFEMPEEITAMSQKIK